MATKAYSERRYNGSAAYDLYDGSAARERVREDPLPRERVRARARQKELAPDFSVAVCIIAAFCALFVMLFSYVRTYETNTKLSKLEQEYGELREENNQLRSQYDSMLDLRTIEQEATERLGMTKPAAGQTVYVNLSGTDRGEVLQANRSALEETALMFREAFAALGAYLSE